ncbi:hypothetical protein LB518_10075 [Mesorhizobium sp. BR1-1-16]|uniref:hypothetical protein n=1 Tax=Mesorhizobium sp. BR1-1-16 TaxID=2876653 RepID=UPI001CCF0299|nr:hypothetical protein [Mesorhizobium sp. BR1-1-16]MBZ9936642.1 hypothetical protein [Mesorhizobium sp. BR1-1-16]
MANSVAQSKIENARNDALAAERIRQNGLDQEAQALNVKSQDRYQDFSGQQDQRGQQLGDYFQGQKVSQDAGNQAAAAEQAQGIMPAASGITVAENAKQSGKAKAFTDAQGAALGQLRAFGDLLGETGRGQARDASLIGQIGGFKKGSSAVLPYELDAASSAGDGAKMFGDILNLAGGFAVDAGLSAPEDYLGKTSSAGTTIDTILPRLRPAPQIAKKSPFSLY